MMIKRGATIVNRYASGSFEFWVLFLVLENFPIGPGVKIPE